MQQREDYGLAYMLQYEHVAWFEDGQVRILDRRIYPEKIEYVVCKNYEEVAKAIADMVTQSAGPYTAAGMGMALAAWQCRTKTVEQQLAFLAKAADCISHARPTTANRMGQITQNAYLMAKQALEAGERADQTIFAGTLASLERRYAIMGKVGDNLAKLFPSDGKILTQCFGETIIGMMLRAAQREQKQIKVYCAETRPYLQGARLTATCCAQMGFDTTVITDNMVAYTMQHKQIDLFTSAADTIARDGHIANKIGTFQIAILAKHFGVPYFVTGIPDTNKKTAADIIIEERDPSDVLSFRGSRYTIPEVKAIYPAFDVTPPYLISGVVTDQGIFAPYDLETYFQKEVRQFY